MSGAIHSLEGAQRNAVAPGDSVWLSASAGTGKTQVLSARVLRLLLEKGTEPSDILCLTFTKAGAAEMAVRVNEVLARWVRMDEGRLGSELAHIGAPADPETRARARSLFARVLDCPGGGLRIDTIHAFAQYLLSAFPGEAGMLPGSRAMDDRERALLSEEVLAKLLSEAQRTDDQPILDAIAELSRRKGPDGVRQWLMRCAAADLWHGPDGWQPPLRARVRGLLGIASDATQDWVIAGCTDDVFDIAALRRCLSTLQAWNTKGGQEGAAAIEEWLSAPPALRVELLENLNGTVFVADGSRTKNLHHLEKRDPDFEHFASRVRQAAALVRERKILLELAEFLTAQLETGRRYALLWEAAKQREGLVDFDDLIRRAADLLSDRGMGGWIRYKLDRRFDHILIDEAQDTNAAQWRIIDALTDDFFSGTGARGNTVRTIFTVGDTKQAIFGFQGTSPANFIEARSRFTARMASRADADTQTPEHMRRPLQRLDLERSFRTADTVLRFVDRAIEFIGYKNFGLEEPPPEHIGEDRPGLVALWNLVSPESENDTEEEDEENWLARHDRQMADRIARQVKAWLDRGLVLSKGKQRRATAGDIMVLVRKRRELASLIVARLYAHGVPVAGVDRLRLGAPLAVKDLMAALRFGVQPLDDLNLACLLVSPLVGWSQEELLAYGYRPASIRLWDHLRAHRETLVQQTVEELRGILARVDFDSPQALLHWLLTGSFDGRRRLVARLGAEANDPIDELLNAASAYASGHTVSLQGFIRWFDAGEGELKRDAGETRDQVRVMTVHGSKGLQAPIVILADAAIAPDSPTDLSLAENVPGARGRAVPLPGLTREQRIGRIAEAYDEAAQRELEEHWRLLYVAMTRAEEALFIGGSLGPRDARRGMPPEDSWYAKLSGLFDGEPVDDPVWGARREWGGLPELPVQPEERSDRQEPALPPWVQNPAPQEPRPPRPLAPSGLGEAEGSDPPFPPDHAVAAARRGVLIHGLLERLPGIATDQRHALARAWLARHGPDLSADAREEMLASALAVLAEPEFADIFSSEALAEIPLAATVGGQVIAGTADRLLVRKERVQVVDFKTARRPPQSLDQVPEATLRQMAAYVAALEAIYPGRSVSAALLYTQTPQLIALPDRLVNEYKARLNRAEESFAPSPVA